MSLFSKTKFVLVFAFVVAYALWFWYTSQSTYHHQLSPIDFRVVETGTVEVTSDLDKQHPALVNLANLAKDETNTVVLVYSSYSYRATLFNWLVAFRNTNRVDPSSPRKGGVLVVCLDQALSDYLVSLGWHCFLDTSSSTSASTSLDKNTVKALWVTRVKQIVELVDAGINIVLTDSDAVWIKDVRHTLLQDGGDVVASRANFPYNSPWGSTLCMGLVLFRANPQVLQLAKLALEETIKVQDDQIGFNNVLFTLKPAATGGKLRNPFGSVQKPDGKVTARTKLLLPNSSSSQLSLTLLAHTKVARACSLITTQEWQQEVEVAHCHVNDGIPLPTNKHKGNSQTHTAILYKYQVFYLREDWESEITNQTDVQFATLLDRIKA